MTRSGYLIIARVAWVPADAGFTPNPEEVADLYRVPLSGVVEGGFVVGQAEVLAALRPPIQTSLRPWGVSSRD